MGIESKNEIRSLKTALTNFKGRNWKGRTKCGNWAVANGGYDLWFEVYYNDVPVMQCVAGELSWCTNPQSFTEEALAVTKKIMNL